MSDTSWERRLDNEKFCPPEPPETPAWDACYELSETIMRYEPETEPEARERLRDVYDFTRQALKDLGELR